MTTQKILLINPSNAPKKRTRKKPRTAAQKAATKKLIAFNKARRKSKSTPMKKRAVSKRKTSTKKRSTTMAARKRRTAAQRAATKKLIAFNKRRKRRKNPSNSSVSRRRAYTASRTASPPQRRRNPIRRKISVRRRRRNPSMKSMGKGLIGGLVMPAVTATGGALALDLAWGYLPIPVQFKTGGTRLLTKSVGAIVLSKLAGFVVSKRTADQMGVGALTVVMHEAAKDLIVKTMPTIKLDGIGYYSPALPSTGYTNGSGGFEDVNGMGMYVGQRPGAVSMGMYAGGEGEDMGDYY